MKWNHFHKSICEERQDESKDTLEGGIDMSGFSGIYFRYEVENRSKWREGEVYKGLVANKYKGFEPYHIFTRATESVFAAIRCLCTSEYDPILEISRLIDTDFITKSIEINSDQRFSFIPIEDKDHYIDYLFFNDCNYYGGFYIDIKGYINERVPVDEEHPYGIKHELKIKYAFVDNTESPELFMTAKEYVSHFQNYFTEDAIGKKLATAVQNILEDFDDDNLMTEEEFEEYTGPSAYEYCFGDKK